MFKFYVISTTIVALVFYITRLAMKRQLERDGYRPKIKKSFIETLRAALPLLLPGFNILLAIVTIFGYEKILNGVRDGWTKEVTHDKT